MALSKYQIQTSIPITRPSEKMSFHHKVDDKDVLMPVPLTVCLPIGFDFSNVQRYDRVGIILQQQPEVKTIATMTSTPRNFRKALRASRTLFESEIEAFKLPEECVAYIQEMDEFSESMAAKEEVTLESKNMCALPLLERLQGWHIEKRERANNLIVDTFYRHLKTGTLFRSFAEVKRFIKYRLYPQKRKNPDDRKSKQATMAIEPCPVSPHLDSLKRDSTVLSSVESANTKKAKCSVPAFSEEKTAEMFENSSTPKASTVFQNVVRVQDFPEVITEEMLLNFVYPDKDYPPGLFDDEDKLPQEHVENNGIEPSDQQGIEILTNTCNDVISKEDPNLYSLLASPISLDKAIISAYY